MSLFWNNKTPAPTPPPDLVVGSPEDLSYSVFIDHVRGGRPSLADRTPAPERSGLDTVRPRVNNSWVPDDAVSNCYNCQRVFSLFWRRHHCRACAKVTCNSC